MPTPQLWRGLRVDNIPSGVTPTQILNLVTTGMIEKLIYHDEMSTTAELRLMNYSSAVHLYVDWHLRRPQIKGNPLKLTWRCIDPVAIEVVKRVAQGASRNVYISNLPARYSAARLEQLCAEYGRVESVRVKGSVAFVHFLSVANAITAADAIKKLQWPDCEVNFGHDRCAHITKHQKHMISLFFGHKSSKLTMDHATLSNTMAQMATAAMTVAVVSGGPQNIGNRTLYLTGLSNRTSLESLCLLGARGGVVQNVRHMPNTNSALITFIDPIAAAQFFSTWNVLVLNLDGHDIAVKWARHTPYYLEKGAANYDSSVTRNVFVGNLPNDFDNDRFTNIMEGIGNFAQVHWVPSSNCVFANFADIDSAIMALKSIRSDPLYRNLPVRFAKDRMGQTSQTSYNEKARHNGPFMLQYIAQCRQLPSPPPEYSIY